MIVKIVNRFGIELETTREIADLMIKRGEISSYDIDGDTVEGNPEIVESTEKKPRNITRKPKI